MTIHTLSELSKFELMVAGALVDYRAPGGAQLSALCRDVASRLSHEGVWDSATCRFHIPESSEIVAYIGLSCLIKTALSALTRLGLARDNRNTAHGWNGPRLYYPTDELVDWLGLS